MSIFNFEIPDNSEDILEKNIKLSNNIFKFIKEKKIEKEIKKISLLLNFPEGEMSFFFSKKIFLNFLNKSTKTNFTKKIKFSWFSRYYLYFFIYPFFLMLFKKKNSKKKKIKYIIDSIGSDIELSLFKNFEKHEGTENILYLSEKKKLKGKNIIPYDFMNTGFRIVDVICYYKIFFYSLKLSLTTKINFVYLSLSFLKEYYYYKNFFLYNNAEFLLTHKHYDTSNVKCFFFKKFGGKIYATIQKNISTTNSNSFFYYADYNFSFSENVKIPIKQRFNYFKKNIPIGSFFMENLFLNHTKNINFSPSKEDRFDVLCVAGNDIQPLGFYDSWSDHNKIYKLHLDWLKQASIEFPKLKFGFKHRQNNNNNFEEKVLEGSNVIIVNKRYNSYDIAQNSKLVLSFASTMIIELLTLGIKSFYLNPDFKNKQFLNDIKDYEKISIKNYLALKNCIINLDSSEKINKYEYCENSEKVTEKIINHLKKL